MNALLAVATGYLASGVAMLLCDAWEPPINRRDHLGWGHAVFHALKWPVVQYRALDLYYRLSCPRRLIALQLAELGAIVLSGVAVGLFLYAVLAIDAPVVGAAGCAGAMLICVGAAYVAAYSRLSLLGRAARTI